MMRASTFFILVLLGLAFFSCQKIQRHGSSASLEQKAEPYDQFAFQRSFPDSDFDWKGWRKRMTTIQSDFFKTLNNNDIPENGSGPDWTLQGPGNVAGRVNTIAIHPENENIVLAGFSAGGIFKTIDGGVSWNAVFDDQLQLSIGDITYDPTNPEIVYAGTGDPNMPSIVFNGNGVYKSADGGESWAYLGLGDEGIVSKVEVDPSNPQTLYASCMGNPYVRDNKRGVYKSTDGGTTWQNVLFVSDQAGASDLVINPANAQILYASFWDRIRSNTESIIYGPHARVYKSTDGGANWTQLGGGLPTGVMGRTGLAISPQNPDKVYAVFIDSLSTPGGLYKTVDGGQTWTSVNILALKDACANFGWYFGKVRVNPVNDEEVYFLAIILWKKEAGSNQWQPAANSHADCHDLQFASTGKRYLGTDGGVYRNAPGVMQWSKSNNLPTTQFYHTSYNPHEPNTYYAGAQDNGIQRGSGVQYNGWESVFPADGFRCAFHPTDPNTFWVETQNGNIHKTTDGGTTWQFGSNCLGTPDRCNWDMPYFISKHNTTRLFAGTYRVYFSENGSGWGTVSGDLTDGIIYGERFHTISCLNESPVQAEKLLAGTSDGNVWRREPAGGWTNITTGLPNRYVTSVSGSTVLANRIFVTHSGFRDNEYIPHIHRSDDNGATWTDISSTLPNVPVNDLYVLPGHADSVLFAATDAGVYVSLSSGQQWQRLGTTLPFVPVFDLERNPVRNELLAATYARGLWTFPLDSIFNLPPAASIAISGTITTESGAGIAQVQVCDQPWQITGLTGGYEILSDAPCLTTGVFPVRDDNPLNGVSTFDLVLINRHILGIELLNSPYKLIAADANNSRTLTTFDIVTLRKLILGVDSVFANTNSWRFIPNNYVFPNPQNPFVNTFPEGVAYSPGSQPQTLHFTGLKVGDVNESATTDFANHGQDRQDEDWPLLLEDQPFSANEKIAVAFAAPWDNMVAAQFTVVFDQDKLELIGLEPVAKGLNTGNFAIRPAGKNCFTTCFENARFLKQSGSTGIASAPETLFRAIFRAKSSGQLKNSIGLGKSPTAAAAFRPDGAELAPLLIWNTPGTPLDFTWQIYPSPIGQQGLWIRQNGHVDTEATLRIFDASGKLVLVKKLLGNLEHIPSSQFPQNGIFWYEIRCGVERQQSGKLLVTRS